MKIFIVGVEKSGTTLVRRLFQAYNLNVCNEENTLNTLINSDYNVVKRTANGIFSNKLKPQDIQQQVDLIKANDIKVINVIRDKEDVLSSSNGYVSEERYNDCVLQYYKHKDIITYTIQYEELIKNPDKIQWDINELLGLTPEFMWSDYPIFVDESKEKAIGSYSLRKIGEGYN